MGAIFSGVIKFVNKWIITICKIGCRRGEIFCNIASLFKGVSCRSAFADRFFVRLALGLPTENTKT